ncbi:MAG: NAD(P)/FAD-dependent oxidoreductase [Candidatus Kuenenbacteria bacterium]
MKSEYDVIIIGAGPAGLSCAIELQSSEKTVLILEKNKKIGPKVCAGGLTTKIESLGLFLDMADILFSSIKMNVPGRIKIVSSNKPFVATIDRSKFGNILLEKLSKKIKVKIDLEIDKVDKIDENFIEIKGQKIKYKYLVGADGSNSIVRRFLGLENKKFLIALQYIIPQKFKQLELFFDVDLFGLGYAWIFPHKDYTSVGCVSNVNFVKTHKLKNNFERWLINQNIKIRESKLESGIINFDYQGFKFGNKFLVGDAAGFASGLTGEGIFFGMVSGQEVAKKNIDPVYKCKEISKILEIKHAHERIFNFMLLLMSINKSLPNFCFRFFFFLFNFKWFTKKALKLHS